LFFPFHQSVDEASIAVEGLGLPLLAGPTNKQKGLSHCGAWASFDDTGESSYGGKGAKGGTRLVVH